MNWLVIALLLTPIVLATMLLGALTLVGLWAYGLRVQYWKYRRKLGLPNGLRWEVQNIWRMVLVKGRGQQQF